MSTRSWLVIVDPCGAVTAVAGGVPERWVNASPAALEAAAPEVAAAAQEVAGDVRRGAPRARRKLIFDDAEVEVVALPAISLHRLPCNLRALIDRALAPFRPQAEARDVLLRVDDEMGEPVALYVDAPKITWLFSTLVGNALRFVRSGSRHFPGGTITVAFRRAGDRLVIDVSDDGPGIEATRLPRLFDASGTSAGTAVALAMARDVATAHGGRLEVQSSTGVEMHGTTVTVELPIATGE